MRIARNGGLTTAVVLALVAALGGCRDDEGASCTLDTDCTGGLLCHPFARICVAPLCSSDGSCTLPDISEGGDAGADAVDAAGAEDSGGAVADTGGTATDTGGGGGTGDAPEAADAGDTGAPSCDMPTTFPGDAWRVTAFQIAPNGKKGSGVDVDEDAATCAPTGNCEAGIDNAFAGAGNLANGFLKDSVDNGTTVLAIYVTPEGADRALWVLDGEEAGAGVRLLPLTWGDCGPKGAVPTVTFDGKALKAGDGGTFVVPLALFGQLLRVPVTDAEVTGKVTDGTLELVLGAALRKKDLDDAIDTLPTDVLGGLTNAQVKDLVAKTYTVDLDTDGNGTKESISTSFLFTGKPTTLSSP